MKRTDRTFPRVVMKDWPVRSGLFTQLTADQQRAALAYSGDENHGELEYARDFVRKWDRVISDFTAVCAEQNILDEDGSIKRDL